MSEVRILPGMRQASRNRLLLVIAVVPWILLPAVNASLGILDGVSGARERLLIYSVGCIIVIALTVIGGWIVATVLGRRTRQLFGAVSKALPSAHVEFCRVGPEFYAALGALPRDGAITADADETVHRLVCALQKDSLTFWTDAVTPLCIGVVKLPSAVALTGRRDGRMMVPAVQVGTTPEVRFSIGDPCFSGLGNASRRHHTRFASLVVDSAEK